MDDFHKALSSELIKDWSITQLEIYIHELERRASQLDEWIKHVKTLRKKKMRQPPVDTGVRGGA